MSKMNFNQTKKLLNGDKKDIRIWKQKTNLISNNIISSIFKSQKEIKHHTDVLNEGERNINKKKILFKSLDKHKLEPGKHSYASDTVKKIMNDVGKLVLNIKTEEDNLSKENVNALLETKNQLKKSDIIQESNKILKIKEKEYKQCLEGKSKKPPNYRFLSDSYRKQVNKVFMDYNPLMHLVNIRQLRKFSPEIDKRFQLQLNELDQCIKSFQASKGFCTAKNKNKKNKKINFEFGQTLPTAATNTVSEGYNNPIKVLSSKTVFGKKFRKNKDMKRKFPDKENREIELELLKNVCEQIDTSISPKTVNNYFNSYNKLKNVDIDSQKNTYFKNINSAQKILREIQENLYMKKMEEDILNKKKYTILENDKLIDKFKMLKSSVLNDINEQEKKQSKI